MERHHADKGHLSPMTPELEEPLDPKDEEETAQEVHEHEFTTFVCLKDRKFTNCLVSSKMDFNVMTYEACKDARFVPTISNEFKDSLQTLPTSTHLLQILEPTMFCTIHQGVGTSSLIEEWLLTFTLPTHYKILH